MKRGKLWPMGQGDTCVMCGSPNVEMHHVIYGTANRRISDEYGYVIPLCREHHTGKYGIHHDKILDLRWKQEAQRDFERRHGTREDFIKVFGRSFL